MDQRATMKTAVVIFDPSEQLLEGEVIDGGALRVALARGVEVLPIHEELLRVSGVGGYAKRSYGFGWKFDEFRPSRGCPLTLYVEPQFTTLHWVVRLVAHGEVRGGMLRVGVDTAQPGAHAPKLAPSSPMFDAARLEGPDAFGGWWYRGKATLAAPSPMLAGLMLYGMLRGVRVAWWAASQGADT